jgi:hypothetical protein
MGVRKDDTVIWLLSYNVLVCGTPLLRHDSRYVWQSENGMTAKYHTQRRVEGTYTTNLHSLYLLHQHAILFFEFGSVPVTFLYERGSTSISSFIIVQVVTRIARY